MNGMSLHPYPKGAPAGCQISIWTMLISRGIRFDFRCLTVVSVVHMEHVCMSCHDTFLICFCDFWVLLMWCRSRWNLEWQVGGTKQESNTSIKAIANKLLSNATTSKEALKSIHAELREGNESWLKLSTMASTRWQQPLRRHRCLEKRQQDLDSHLHHHHLLHTSSTAGGTISDSDVWNARLCLQLCGCTAHTIGIVDIYAPSSNCGSSGVEWATTATFGPDGCRWIRSSTRGRVTNTAPPRKQTFRDVFEWVRSWLHSPCWRIPPQTPWRVPSKVSLRRSNLKVAKFPEREQ